MKIKPSRALHYCYTVAFLFLFTTGQSSQTSSSGPRPVDGTEAIIKAFDKYPVVALGDLHGCQELYDFITPLVRNPEFVNKVDDIVIEFGNALYQDVADRYVSGKEVPLAEVRQIWRNHTNPIVFDSPVYEQFFKTIREVNQSAPEGKRLRVLLGDPPIDWSKTQTNKEWGRMLFRRDSHFVEVMEKEVFAKDRRAFLIIGAAHLVRRLDKNNVTGRIESQRPQMIMWGKPLDDPSADNFNTSGRYYVKPR